MNKKLIAASVLVLAATIALPVFAQTTATTSTTAVAPATTAAPVATTASEQPIIQVGAAGKVLFRGTIASISSTTLTVNSWGGTWTIDVASGASILPAAANGSISQFSTGDFVGVQGTVSQSANWTINATLVRDWTYRAAVVQQQQQNIQAAQVTKQSAPRDYIGTASAVNASSFTLAAKNGTSYTVSVPSGAEIVNAKWITIPLTSVNSGDNVRVYGVNTSGTIIARIVRDVTITATTTTQ
jgi:hypothetical protein